MSNLIAPRNFVRVALLTFGLIILGGGSLAAANPASAAVPECSTSGGITVCMGEVIIISRVP
jgi:hypothetical protein